jgi:hypothetical protein
VFDKVGKGMLNDGFFVFDNHIQTYSLLFVRRTGQLLNINKIHNNVNIMDLIYEFDIYDMSDWVTYDGLDILNTVLKYAIDMSGLTSDESELILRKYFKELGNEIYSKMTRLDVSESITPIKKNVEGTQKYINNINESTIKMGKFFNKVLEMLIEETEYDFSVYDNKFVYVKIKFPYDNLVWEYDAQTVEDWVMNYLYEVYNFSALRRIQDIYGLTIEETRMIINVYFKEMGKIIYPKMKEIYYGNRNISDI